MDQTTSSAISDSLWSDTADKPKQYQSLMADISADVCVIGAGISGLTVAYFLQKAGKKVIVVEAKKIGAGETSRTTAHLASALDDGLVDLQKLFGKEKTQLAVASHQEAIRTIERIVEAEKIDCDFAWVDAYLLSNTAATDADLRAEYQAAQDLGYKVKEATLPIEKLHKKKTICFAEQAQFHPLKYLYGLAEAFIKHGGKIVTDTSISDVKETEEQVLISTAAGKCITADFAVVATNTPFINRVTMHTKQAAYRSYVVGMEIAKGAIPIALYWDMKEPYHYIRIYERHQAKTDILIVGGEDHKTGQDDHEGKQLLALETWARKYFSQVGKVLYQWSGQVMEPVDSLAFIGLNPGNQRTFIVTGDSGHGLTHGTIAGVLITDLILGKENPWTEIYSPSRKTIGSFCQFLKENLNVAKQYTHLLNDSEVEAPEKIKPGEGAVIRKGVKQCALFRDEKDQLHEMSAVCPHLGCIVQWNTMEKSWDCPCHGSRFSSTGKVLNGPATEDLKKL